MKTQSFLIMILAASAIPLFAANDPKAVQLFDKAAELHGLSSAKSLETFEMETVYSSFSGGFEGPSRWLQRMDFKQGLDLGVRYVYASNTRGAMYQRRIQGDKGEFMYNIGSKATYDLGGFFGGNAVDGISSVVILAIRGQLADLKYVGTAQFGDKTLDEVSFSYRGGKGGLYFSKDGRYAGKYETDLRDNHRMYHIVTAYQNFGTISVPSRFTLYDDKRAVRGYGKLVSFKANPVFNAGDFAMKVTQSNEQGSVNPFGLSVLPANQSEFTGLRVSEQPIDIARKAGLAQGDEFVSINGEDVRTSDYFELEQMFWDRTELTLGVLKTDKKSVEIKLVR